MNWWMRFHRRAWPMRWLVKGAAIAVTALLIAYPYPHFLARNVLRWRNPNTLIEPDNPRLQPLVAELQEQLDPDLPPRQTLKRVERFVYTKVPYAWDWETWGVADYIPTVDEVLDAEREDCDGRAVIAASLHRALGYKADIVSDFAHVWVKTDRGETMSPGKSKSLVASDRTGTRVQWRTLLNVPRAIAYGIGVFPLARELILVIVIWLALLRPGVRPVIALLALWLILEGLLKMRAAVRFPPESLFPPWRVLATLQWGIAVVMLFWAGRRAAAARSAAGPTDSGVPHSTDAPAGESHEITP
jgi:hypothetical protein